MDIREIGKGIVSVVISGYQLWTGMPVDRYELELKEIRDDERTPAEHPRRTYFFRWRSAGLLGPWSDGGDAQVTVYTESRDLIGEMSTHWLFGGLPYLGSAAIGIALVSAPVMLPLSPLLFAVKGIDALRTKQTGLDVFSRRFLRAAKKALGDGEDYELLRDAVVREAQSRPRAIP